jgi:hypothetical protein
MLYALRTPTAFVALLAGFLLGVVVHVVAQRLVARTRHSRVSGIGARRRTSLRDTLWGAVDPFGAVAAALGGTGWARSPELPHRRRRGWERSDLVLLAGPAANLAVAAVALLLYRAIGGPGVAAVASLPDLLHGQVSGLPLPVLALLLVGVQNLAMGLLALVPMPPLDGGRLLFAHAPGSPGWQRAEYYLAEHNWGVAVLLVLLLLPIAGEAPLLLVLLDLVGRPLLGLLTGS